MERETKHHSGRPMDYSDIDARFEPFYDSGERVEVTWKPGYEDFSGFGSKTNGLKARFYVGKSTGWKPVFLELFRRNSRGGQIIFSDAVESIRGLRIYKSR